MKGVKTKIAFIMDEIDGMNTGDKGGITALIKLIRQKKTKKQKLENRTINPIICIGNYYVDKKINELIKVCNSFELKAPTREQMRELLKNTLPLQYTANWSFNTLLFSESIKCQECNIEKLLLDYIQGDMRKLFFVKNLYEKKPEIISEKYLKGIFHIKSFNEEPKVNTYRLFKEPIPLSQHSQFMNETDRTIIALLWHENIIDLLEKNDSIYVSENKCSEKLMNYPKQSVGGNQPAVSSEGNVKKLYSFTLCSKRHQYNFYLKVLNNICFADYIDRVTFQNQIWNLNEMSSLIKTFYNNQLYHETKYVKNNINSPSEIRFTKVLTKYSTEYNNVLFFYKLSQELNMDKKDVVTFFQEIRQFYGESFLQNPDILGKLEKDLEKYNISKLDIRRIYRYLDKNVKKENTTLTNEDLEDEEENEEEIE
jgi:hypothetical protein